VARRIRYAPCSRDPIRSPNRCASLSGTMNAVDVLRVQLRGACDLVAEHAGSVEPVWLERASPATSLPGFIVWHCARIIDWGVNTCVRDAPEVAAESPLREKLPYGLGP